MYRDYLLQGTLGPKLASLKGPEVDTRMEWGTLNNRVKSSVKNDETMKKILSMNLTKQPSETECKVWKKHRP